MLAPPLPMHISNRSSASDGFFTEFTIGKGILYFSSFIYVFSVLVVALMEPYVSLPCDGETSNLEFANPAFDSSPCRNARYAHLLWVTREECSYARRLVASVVLGGLIGWERRHADRPAGIRTMALVSLGSALFTICSIAAFLIGPMSWDASRVSAAIPSGVGFLGAGLIFKEKQDHGPGEPTTHVVHGLTTAASVWLSAAVGIACGGGLYFAASFGAAIMLLLLRFGPRNKDLTDDDHDYNNDAVQQQEYSHIGYPISSNQANTSTRQMSKRMMSERVMSERDGGNEPGETDSLVSESTLRRSSCVASIRKNRASLSSRM